METFSTLYKKSSKGKIQEWTILVENSDIIVIHGQKGGKKQTERRTIDKGKNHGKLNATTPQEQAQLEALSKWKKQLDKGYVDNEEDVNNILYRPMLAQTFSKIKDGKETGRKKYIKYPCLAQRKFDGVRSSSYLNVAGESIIESRKGKIFPHLEHLYPQIKKIIGELNIIVDGELYSDELSFQRLSGLVRKDTFEEIDFEDMKKIKIRVYDCILKDEPDASFENRFDYIKNLIEVVCKDQLKDITIVENFEIFSEDDIKPFHDQFVQEGFEGIILRNKKGIYAINKRSNDLQKYKYFEDSEYPIIGFAEGTGRDSGTVIWICETIDKKEFNVRPIGTHKQRTEWFNRGIEYIGSMLTVRYQEKTDEGKPRFGVGVGIRDYE